MIVDLLNIKIKLSVINNTIMKVGKRNTVNQEVVLIGDKIGTLETVFYREVPLENFTYCNMWNVDGFCVVLVDDQQLFNELY